MRLRSVFALWGSVAGAAVAAIAVSLVALILIVLAVGASGAGGPALADQSLHVAIQDGAVAFYVTQLVSVSFFHHTAGLRFIALPGLVLVAVAIATSAMFAARLVGGSTRRRMLVATLMPIPYALISGLGARYLSLHLTGPVIGRDTPVMPAPIEAFLLPLCWGLLFAPLGGLVGVFGRSWRGEALQRLGAWGTPLRCSLRALAIGLALTSIVVVIGGALLVGRSGGAGVFGGGDLGHAATVAGGLLVALPTLVVAVFLACFGVSFDWRVEALSHTQGSGSILGGALPTLGTSTPHQVPALFASLLLLCAVTVLLVGWLTARRSGESVRLGMANALRAGALMTMACWLFALVARVDAQAGGYLGAHFEVDVVSLLWRVPLWCLLGSFTGSLAYVASRGASSRRRLAIALRDAARPSRPPAGWFESWRKGLASRAALGAGFLSLPALLMGIGSAGATSPTGSATFSLAPISQAAEQRLRTDSVPGSFLSVTVDPSTRVIDSANTNIPIAALGVSSSDSPVVKAKAVLARYGDLFGMSGRAGELGDPQVVTEPITKTQHIGMTHVYFQQMAAGVPVFGGSIGVHLSRDGKHLDFISGAFVPDVSLAARKVAIGSARSLSLAKIAMPAGKVRHRPRLEVYTGSQPVGAAARLAWFVWLASGPLKPSKEYVIDAVNGSILHVFNKSFNLKTMGLKLYNAEHKSGPGTLPGKLAYEEGGVEPEDKDTKDAKINLEDTWKFFRQEILSPRCAGPNCAGEPTIGTVHYGKEKEYEQAEWNPEHQEVVFGDGWPAALDIVGHEYSQGVVENITHEADEGQSGALGEGWADAMGKAVEAYTKRTGETWAEPNWGVGTGLPHGAIRNLKEPGKYSEIAGHPDPEKLSEYVPACIDNNGMHENSTIISHAFYLLSSKIGIEEATRVFYRMQMVYMVNSPTATLELARGVAVRAADDLFGEGTTKAKETEAAFSTVGLNGIAQPLLECNTPSECSAGKALADQQPANGTASTLNMLATLYRARGKLAQTSTSGHYFMPLYEQHMGRITELVSLDPTLEEMTLGGLQQITPALNALAEGEGEKFKLSAWEMGQIEAALKRLAQDDRMYSGGGSLAKLIDRELKWLRLPSYAGKTYAEGFSRLNTAVASRPASAPPPSTFIVDPNCEKPYTNEFQVYGFSVDTPGHNKPGEISPINSTGVACGAKVERAGSAKTCSNASTLNTKLTLELPPGDKIHHTSEMTNGSYIGKVSGRTIGCAGEESRIVFGITGLRTLKTWSSSQCPESAIACYEGSGSFEAGGGYATGKSYSWVKEEVSKRLVLTTGPVEVEGEKSGERIKIPVSFGQFGVHLCGLAGEPGTEACGTSPTAWVHKNGEESQPGCPTENGRYVARVTNKAEKTTLPAESCVYWGEEAHKQLIDSGNSVNAVACVPETTECAVTDSKGGGLYSTNVSATAAATWKTWSGPASTSPGEALACPASSLCALADGKATEGGGGNMYYATSLGGTWTEAFKATHGALAVSCPTSSFCVDSQEGGRIRYATSPASTSWTEVTVGAGAMNGVFCRSSAFCAAVNGSGDLYVANTEAHIKEATGWKSTDIDGAVALHGVACTSTTSCVAVDGEGHVLDLTINGSGEATVAKHAIDGTNDLTAITCTTGDVCVAVDSKGNVLVSTSGGETWNDQHTSGTDLTSVSCSSPSLCVTGDTSGNVTTFTPIGVPPSHAQTVSSGNSVSAVSCVALATECVVTDSKGNAQYSTNVSVTAPATWSSWTGPSSPSEAVACPTRTLCVLGDGNAEEGGGGNMYYASSLGGAWKESFSPVYGVAAVSCGSAALCVAAQAEGFIHYTTKPASTEWFALSIGSGTMNAVDCLSASFCAVVDSSGHIHVANTEAKIKEAGGWKSTDVDGTVALHGVACTSTTACMAVDGAGHVIDLTVNAGGEATASSEDLDGTNDLTAIACTGASCATVDSKGDVFTSSNAGSTWKNELALGTDLTSVSCSASTLCLAADTTGGVTAFGAE